MNKRFISREPVRVEVSINALHKGYALDISPEGMLIKISVAYKVGALLTLRFNINGVPIEARAIIKSIRPGFGIGVQFQNLRESSQDIIDDFIEQNKEKRKESKRKGGQPAVLLVDDNQASIEQFENQLFLAGIDVIRAHNGVEAIKKIEEEKNKIGLVITDLLMPIMDGFMLIHYLKETPKFSNIPIVILSGFHKGKTDIQKVTSLGVDAGNIFMKQNSRVDDFATAVSRILKESK